MFPFLLVVHAIIATVLVGFILMQKSEGGGLGMGGSPSGLMSARGAADFLTRGTSIAATFFVIMSIVLAILAATRHSSPIDTSLARRGAAAPVTQQAPIVGPGAPPAAAPNTASPGSPPPASTSNSQVPLGQ